MNISFTGINNISTNLNVSHPPFAVKVPDGIYKGTLDESEGDFKCKLTNDESGKDLDDFNKAVQSNPQFKNIDDPSILEVKYRYATRPWPYVNTMGEVRLGTTYCYQFKVNGQLLSINDEEKGRKNLPMLDFIAKLSSKLTEKTDLPPEQIEAMKELNTRLQQLGIHYIDDVMYKKEK